MPSTPLFYTSGIVLATALSSATEAVIATVTGVTTRYAGQNVTLLGYALITTPGSTTAVTTRIRRTSLTGTVVSDATAQAITAAAGTSNAYMTAATDGPGDVDSFTYVLTAACTAGSGAGSAVWAYLEARVD